MLKSVALSDVNHWALVFDLILIADGNSTSLRFVCFSKKAVYRVCRPDMASHTFTTRCALRLLVSLFLLFSAVSHGFKLSVSPERETSNLKFASNI